MAKYEQLKHIIKKYHETKKGKYATAKANAKYKHNIPSELFEKKVKNGCEECGFNEYLLDFHHLDKNKKNNTDKNLRYLCPNCHHRYHRKKIL